MSDFLTPNNSVISYSKLLHFVQHQINLFKEEIAQVEGDTLFYVLHEPETLKNYSNLQTGLEQWEFMKEILKERINILEV